MPQAGFGVADITPPLGVELAGYFNKRFATRVLDPLYARALVVQDADVRLAVLVFDLIGLDVAGAGAVRTHLAGVLGAPPSHVIFSCTHTHTGPSTARLFEAESARDYVRKTLLPGAEDACRQAIADLAPFKLRCGGARERGLAFCRRYWMKNGRVMTNPPKGSPDIVRPESEIDHTVQVFSFERDSAPAALIVDANNHCDTIGTSEISADWPGWMARALARQLRRDVPVLLLNGPAGNINHFDHSRPERQASYAEAERIGRGYAGFALEALEGAEPVSTGPVKVLTVSFDVPYRRVAPEALERARALAAGKPPDTGKDITAEDLAKGHPYVDWVYAQELVRFHESCGSRVSEQVELCAFRIGDCAFVGLPGEPFSDLGIAIKSAGPMERTCVFSLYGGLAGYIPLAEHFERGGYEQLTTTLNRFAPEAGQLFIENALRLLAALT